MDLSTIVARRPLTDVAEAYSGAWLESAELPDGRRVVLKHLAAEGDWLTRATNGEGRLRSMWESGVFGVIGRFVDHTILGVADFDDRDVVVMRDATKDLLPPRISVSRDTSRELLAGLAIMHEGCFGVSIDRPCPIEARFSMFAPAVIGADTGPGSHPSRDYIVSGWEVFDEHVDADIVKTVFDIHRDPGWLGKRLGRFPSTLLHGDAKLANLGMGSDRLVAIDWADLTGSGPPEIDVAWYALKGCDRIGCMPDDVFSDYEETSGRPLEPEALDVACIGSLAQMGFSFAAGAFAPASAVSPVASALLDWWVNRAFDALDRIGVGAA